MMSVFVRDPSRRGLIFGEVAGSYGRVRVFSSGRNDFPNFTTENAYTRPLYEGAPTL
jgi:hypothetical protein